MLELLESSVWAIEPRYFNQYERVILAMLESGHVDASLIQTRKESRPIPLIAYVGQPAPEGISAVGFTSESADRSNRGIAGKVAVIPLQGPMMKNGGMCSHGTREVMAWLDDANANPEVSAIVLHVDSPGGAVDGTEALATAIRTSAKPVVAFIDGMGASAAYWASSQSSKIFISSATGAWAGSIGTLLKHVDQSAQLTVQGIKITYITAERSTDKVLGNSTEPLTEEVIAYFKADLNAINDTFISAVQSGRGDRLTGKADVFTAKIYNGKDAVKYGLADKVGSLADAIREAAALGKKATTSSNSNSNSPKTTMLDLPRLAAMFGFTPSASAQSEITEAQAAAAEASIVALEGTRDTLTAQVTDLTAQIGALTTDKTGLEATVQTLTTANSELQAKVDQLEGWKANSLKVGAKPEDESNKDGGTPAAKTSWESAAEQYRQSLGQGK